MRKVVLLTIALLMIFAQNAVQAQKKKKTVTSKAYITATNFVDEEGWTRYVSTEGKFNVLLPAKPERKSELISSPLGKKQLVTYTSAAGKISYVVGFLDFKIPINDENSLKTIYDSWQEGVTGVYPNGELEQKETTFDGKPAREITYVAGLMSIRAKAFFTRGKLFQMMTFHLVESEDALSQEVSLSRDKFFSSIQLENAVVQTKNTGLAGVIEENVYRNSYFNFTMNVPKDWISVKQEDTEILKEGSKGKKDVQTSLKKTTFLFHLTAKEIGSVDNASIIGAAEVVPPVKATLAQIAAATALNFVTSSGYTLEGAVKYPKFGSLTFAAISLKKSNYFGGTIHQKLYMTRLRGYLLEFLCTYTDEKELAVFEEMMKTLQFTKVK